MTVDEQLILRLAKLSRLAPTPEQTDRLRADLVNILGMVEKLDELDLAAVAPLRYVTGVENVLRPDASGDHLDRAEALANAPDADQEGGYFRVPRVI
ncbi:Asp-tRNA(Asn)/Glu-tRNA(Gln) amidotransferase subunit GatC [Neolewinella lacunae]|uniref:Aspartyl/glutamyl-tRNA(Asn/Gln) amidotransferase subunit C n=1 Tax=Neolewinella lacunae TaxID=1517758 RepID=A0A923PQM1_9BACT|nr:Asp-tRNA(Asn)/Glu-tRNA(Gln) amidotransferase subunit GatC [Neolewinella lacunae]MBC6995986.1 Asp-tRNA(Asn)/Glu-tRNA(Gln) amidotransferase subunit GatC [Neolewinella lacunae]MDN3633160.1 Asp-tRNA(Asn)/Glu-tRNA(Gln) amidotransferase subunit GatC [Neolewinella lacunae]